MMWIVSEIDIITGGESDPSRKFSSFQAAEDHARTICERWREEGDEIISNGRIFLVNTDNGLLDYGAIIREAEE